MAKLPKPKLGRPNMFTPELGEFICELVATQKTPLDALCKLHDELPANARTINAWRWKYEEFGAKFNKAKEFEAQLLAEEIIEIVDDSSGDYIENKKGKMVFNPENVRRAKLRFEGRKYVASKLCRRHYGERVAVDLTDFSHDKWVAKFNKGETIDGIDTDGNG